MTTAEWMNSNLEMQDYCLADPEKRAQRFGLRFSTGACLGLTAGALVLGSPIAFLLLAGIGAVAGFTLRHPFDYAWNGAVRHLVSAPAVPPSPQRRRHAFKVATVWMLVLAGLFAAGAQTAALVAGALLLVACATVTVTNLCLPSLALSLIERRRKPAPA